MNLAVHRAKPLSIMLSRTSKGNVLNDGDLIKRLEVVVSSNEKYRSRARAVATLCAAAAGALAAGLVLAPTESMPDGARIFGLCAVVLLIIATALGVVASSATAYQKGKNHTVNFLRLLEMWRIQVPASQNSTEPHQYVKRIADAEAVQNGIGRIVDFTLWVAFAAALSIITSLAWATFADHEARTVDIRVHSRQEFVGCPSLDQSFNAVVFESDLEMASSLLPVEVSANECGNEMGAILYLDRSSVSLMGRFEE